MHETPLVNNRKTNKFSCPPVNLSSSLSDILNKKKSSSTPAEEEGISSNLFF